ncbi:glycosyltransferase [Siccirubricoccus sp. KC 17139]|uniref:Glycosyltransferase n=1 Tax=Siccirubricoccus soli TaxID=2899147 RepID=A0ABT1D736_9PROT|nr:glycosyltransferase [Siccirubricoccus soli]MCO6417741.1 glycosyltransferase [Siccirubricoccus soli]MCP2683876.1 glycosyltransferase [Siccirubricoccus soli]
MAGPIVSIAVFAYNEEAGIAACLDAIGACAAEARLRIYVLINGCRDRTEEVVRAYRPAGFELVPVVIQRGDKANAWNHYTHEVAPEDAAIHVFTDADVMIAPGSIAGFLAAFAAAPEADACAGLPVSGRTRAAFRANLVREKFVAGNLYALRDRCVMAFRRRGLRLPFGMFGEDGLVGTLIKWNLDTRGERDDRRIIACEAAGFSYPSLSPFRPGDWRIYHNRMMRYAVRRQQANMLYPLLWEEGAAAMPAHVLDLYRARHRHMRLRWNGLNTWFDWRACRRIRRDILADDSVRQAERAHLYS